MRVLNFERAEIVLLPEAVWRDLEREVLAPRAKVVAGIPEGLSPDQLVSYVDSLSRLRWGAKAGAETNKDA